MDLSGDECVEVSSFNETGDNSSRHKTGVKIVF